MTQITWTNPRQAVTALGEIRTGRKEKKNFFFPFGSSGLTPSIMPYIFSRFRLKKKKNLSKEIFKKMKEKHKSEDTK